MLMVEVRFSLLCGVTAATTVACQGKRLDEMTIFDRFKVVEYVGTCLTYPAPTCKHALCAGEGAMLVYMFSYAFLERPIKETT